MNQLVLSVPNQYDCCTDHDPNVAEYEMEEAIAAVVASMLPADNWADKTDVSRRIMFCFCDSSVCMTMWYICRQIWYQYITVIFTKPCMSYSRFKAINFFIIKLCTFYRL